ncbi:hypothetical protein GCM10010145_44570 [Streptomyces ruber]|uniref:Uncharacterized protein n=1 Tax=Streptomyces ruber TaxID=83378 RepID=A0A918EW00_9ACTN|nr:hypothetical protein GCM10010145_44570 [Streptomyces ruber]
MPPTARHSAAVAARASPKSPSDRSRAQVTRISASCMEPACPSAATRSRSISAPRSGRPSRRAPIREGVRAGSRSRASSPYRPSMLRASVAFSRASCGYGEDSSASYAAMPSSGSMEARPALVIRRW